MGTAELFKISPEHLTMATLGGVLLLAWWLPRLLFRLPPPPYAFVILLGCLANDFLPAVPVAAGTSASSTVWERTSELVIIVVLFSTGLKIDKVGDLAAWSVTARLLAIAMPLTVAAVALLGWSLAGMSLAGAILLGAVLAPTDPVLAGDVQVRPPFQGGENPSRFALTTEAGLNDGLAFPFVYLGLLAAHAGGVFGETLGDWVLRDVLFRIAAGAVGGAVAGWVMGKIVFAAPARSELGSRGSGVVALSGALLSYGVVELAGGYGFVAVFVSGLVFRRVKKDDPHHRRLHVFSEAIDHALTATLLVWLGSALPDLWTHLSWRLGLVGLCLLLLVRPAVAWVSLIGAGLARRDHVIVSFFGVRGVSSIYYVAYVTGKDLLPEGMAMQLWAAVAYTVLASAVLHGFSRALAWRESR